MAFNSVQYFVFLLAVLALYWTCPRRGRPVVLLAASYAFYGLRDWRFVPVLLGATIVTWALGRWIGRSEGRARGGLLAVAVIVSLAVLFAFKALRAATVDVGQGGLGVQLVGTANEVVVPVGLAFYTFQTVSYLIDVYRREISPESSFVLYATYVAFFPHLLAGPVVRARRLIPQFVDTTVVPDRVQVAEGLELLFLGLFKKVAVADPLMRTATEFLGPAFLGDASIGTPMVLVAAVSAIIAGYFDIAGYIDMARGSAKLLGIEMPPNFAQPLTRSRNWTDFWRRWQITVMGWFRDYVYLPIRTRNVTEGREAMALIGTFLAAGIWHGLSLGWVVWGVLTGGVLVVERHWRRGRSRRPKLLPKRVRAVTGPLYVMALLLLVAPWSAARSFDQGFAFYRLLFTSGLGTVDANLLLYGAWGFAILLLNDFYERRRDAREGRPDPITVPRAVAYGVMAATLVVFSGAVAQDFLYFQF